MAKKRSGKWKGVEPEATPVQVLTPVPVVVPKVKSPLALKLAKLADSCGMWPSDVAALPKRLEEIGLTRDDVDKDTIRAANAIVRGWDLEVKDRVEAHNAKILERQRKRGPQQEEQVEAPEEREEREAKPKKTRRMGLTILGYPATSVVRWMGKKKWSLEQATKVVQALNVPLAPATIKIQLKAGLTGDPTRGPAATITPKQEKELQALKKS